MEHLKTTFDTFEPSLKCCICGKELGEGYHLHTLTNNAFEQMEKRFGDPSNWTVGECCFGGYCGANVGLDVDDWFERFVIEGETKAEDWKEGFSGQMKCPNCGSSLVGLYCRNGAGGKRWIKVNEKYCKTCKKVIEK